MRIKYRYLTFGLLSLLIMIIVAYLRSLYVHAKLCDGWIIGDWLINYDAGFVRRGLGGFTIIKLSDILKIKPNYMVSILQSILYLSYTSILIFILSKKKISFWYLVILLSPVALLFPILDGSAVGRKEIILFFIFSIYLLCLNTNLLKSNFIITLFCLALIIATLFHELVFFYTPYFLVAYYLKSKLDNKPLKISKIILLVIIPFFTMLSIFFWGKNINGGVICEGLMEQGLSAKVCSGMLSWPNDFGVKDVLNFATISGYYLYYSATFMLGIIPYYFFIKKLNHPIVSLKFFFIGFAALLLFSSPLFILATDWGRWINIHFILLLLTSTLLLKEKTSTIKSTSSSDNVAIPKLWPTKSSIASFANRLTVLIIFVAYITSWNMNHCAGGSFFSSRFYQFISVFYHICLTIFKKIIHLIFVN